MTKKETPQARWDKENLGTVKASFKKDFVNEFKEVCKENKIVQADLIRDMMEDTIKKYKKV